jgi:hypothetical protein
MGNAQRHASSRELREQQRQAQKRHEYWRRLEHERAVVALCARAVRSAEVQVAEVRRAFSACKAWQAVERAALSTRTGRSAPTGAAPTAGAVGREAGCKKPGIA